MPPRLFAFDAPLPSDETERLVGAKGASLRRLTAMGFHVPPGFTIGIAAIDELGDRDPAESTLWDEVELALMALQQRCGRSWGAGPDPLTVAVRSGAAESHPGRMLTLLHCGWTAQLADQAVGDRGWREFADFLTGIVRSTHPDRSDAERDATVAAAPADPPWRERCLQLLRQVRSEWGARDDTPQEWLRLAIQLVARSARSHAEQLWSTAVTVQAMVPADLSGVLRSRDPRSPESGQMLIETVIGFGAGLMAGEETPTIIHLPRTETKLRSPASTADDDGAAATNLPESVQSALRQAALRLEAEVGFAVEVEWSLQDDQLWFLQYRRARDEDAVGLLVEREVARLRQLARDGRRVWVRHQLAEALPSPTRLSWSLWDDFVSPTGGIGALYRHLGYSPRPFADGRGCLLQIAGRIYVDPDRWVQLICPSFPWRHDNERLRATPEHLHEPPTRFDPQRLDPWFLLKWPHLLWVLQRSRRRRRHLERTAAEDFEQVVVPRYQSEFRAQTAAQATLSGLGARVAFVEQLRGWLFDDHWPQLLLPGWLGIQAWHVVARELRESDLSDPVRVELDLLREVERGTDRPRAEISGHVGKQQAQPWADVSLELADGIDALDTDSSRCAEVATLATMALEAGLPPHWEPIVGRLSPAARQALAVSRRLLPLRSVGQQLFLAGYDLLRRELKTIAIESKLGRLLYELDWSELRQLEKQPTPADLLERRRRERELWRQVAPPATILGDAAIPLADRPVVGTNETWKVTPVSSGVVEGRVWRPSAGVPHCPPGAIVVAESLDPVRLWRWRSAGGFLVERGGMLSHAAVTARQLGLPLAIMATTTRCLEHNELLLLDATTGLVRRVVSQQSRRVSIETP